MARGGINDCSMVASHFELKSSAVSGMGVKGGIVVQVHDGMV